jgi:hypothetical protein
MRDLDVDLERRYSCTAIHPHPDIFAVDGDLLRDRRQNLLAQNGKQIEPAARPPFVGQEDLKPFPRQWRGS